MMSDLDEFVRVVSGIADSEITAIACDECSSHFFVNLLYGVSKIGVRRFWEGEHSNYQLDKSEWDMIKELFDLKCISDTYPIDGPLVKKLIEMHSI